MTGEGGDFFKTGESGSTTTGTMDEAGSFPRVWSRWCRKDFFRRGAGPPGRNRFRDGRERTVSPTGRDPEVEAEDVPPDGRSVEIVFMAPFLVEKGYGDLRRSCPVTGRLVRSVVIRTATAGST